MGCITIQWNEDFALLQFDEEDYESLDKGVVAPNIDALATQLKRSLEERAQATATTQPTPFAQANRRTLETIPPRSRPVTETTQHPSTLPRQASRSQGVQGHLTDECNSDEYESVKENVSVLPVHARHTGIL
jgi:hypothetical protein